MLQDLWEIVPEVKRFWRTGASPEVESVYNVSFALTLISLVFAFVLTMIFVINRFWTSAMSETSQAINKVIFIILGAVGLILLFVSIVHFAVRLPIAIRKDSSTGCGVGPCNRFGGNTELSGTKLSWGPIGWIPAVVCLPFYFIMVVLGVLLRDKKEYTGVDSSARFELLEGN
eukprot:TRINITY_DN1182_c2_g1_i2.p2 TRINITY_DN1182_c2_g1~~TRINITY_DN1182_c2_g1_i2.p2  ORF type:complete len:173 (-),score=24.72 TRINITY_DN1182_c2_g1_i2:430-948(-)